MNQEQKQGWDRGWEEHKLRQMERMARLPFAKKLQWLEEAHHLVIALARSRAASEKAELDKSKQTPSGP